MGLDKNKKTPCGFCFVVYYARKDAEDAVKYLSGTRVDERPIRVDFDWGFVEGRQFGRGRGGGQVCDSNSIFSEPALSTFERRNLAQRYCAETYGAVKSSQAATVFELCTRYP